MDEQLQQQIVQLVQAAMQGDQLATQYIQQIIQAALQGDLQAILVAQMIQQVAQQMQQLLVQAAKFGAKLNYIRQLKGICPEGYEMQYYKSGGQLCKRCMKKQQDGGTAQPMDLKEQFNIESARCGKKMKKKACGGSVEKDKCGSKMDKAACGKKLKKKACGGSKLPFHKAGGKEPTWTNTDGGYESIKTKNGKTSHMVSEPGITYARGFDGKQWNSKKNPEKVDSVRNADGHGYSPLEKKPKLQKKANGGSFIPFPRAGQK